MDFFVLLLFILFSLQKSTVEAPGKFGRKFLAAIGIRKPTTSSLQDGKCDALLNLFKAAVVVRGRQCHVRFTLDDTFHEVLAEFDERYRDEYRSSFHYPKTRMAFSLKSYSIIYVEWSKELLVEVNGPIVGGKFLIPTSEEGCKELFSEFLPEGTESLESLAVRWTERESLKPCATKWKPWVLHTSYGKAVLVSPKGEEWAFFDGRWDVPPPQQ